MNWQLLYVFLDKAQAYNVTCFLEYRINYLILCYETLLQDFRQWMASRALLAILSASLTGLPHYWSSSIYIRCYQMLIPLVQSRWAKRRRGARWCEIGHNRDDSRLDWWLFAWAPRDRSSELWQQTRRHPRLAHTNIIVNNCAKVKQCIYTCGSGTVGRMPFSLGRVETFALPVTGHASYHVHTIISVAEAFYLRVRCVEPNVAPSDEVEVLGVGISGERGCVLSFHHNGLI